VDQLTQKELQDIQSHLEVSELLIKKCEIYENQVKDDELKNWMSESAAVHQSQIQLLTDQLRHYDGKKHNQ
jgi:hypothetical protein